VFVWDFAHIAVTAVHIFLFPYDKSFSNLIYFLSWFLFVI
jgi:hypothetical protein